MVELLKKAFSFGHISETINATELLLVILRCLIIIQKVYSQKYEAQVPRLGYLEAPEV